MTVLGFLLPPDSGEKLTLREYRSTRVDESICFDRNRNHHSALDRDVQSADLGHHSSQLDRLTNDRHLFHHCDGNVLDVGRRHRHRPSSSPSQCEKSYDAQLGTTDSRSSFDRLTSSLRRSKSTSISISLGSCG